MIHEIAGELSKRYLAMARDQSPPQVSRVQRGKQIDRPRHDQYPGVEKMEASTPSVVVEDIVGPPGRDRRRGCCKKGFPGSPTVVVVISADRQLEKGRRQ